MSLGSGSKMRTWLWTLTVLVYVCTYAFMDILYG